MTKTIVLLAFCVVAITSLQIHQDLMLGGWQNSTVNSTIDEYIRSKYPQLKNAKLVGTESKIVSGIDYRYTYDLNNVIYKVTVWEQSWLNHIEITGIQKIEIKQKSDGTKEKVTTTTKIESEGFAAVTSNLFV